jgi:hypothetical protein
MTSDEEDMSNELVKAHELAERLDNEWAILLPESRRESVAEIARLLCVAVKQPSRSKRLLAAGFTPRPRLPSDE